MFKKSSPVSARRTATIHQIAINRSNRQQNTNNNHFILAYVFLQEAGPSYDQVILLVDSILYFVYHLKTPAKIFATFCLGLIIIIIIIIIVIRCAVILESDVLGLLSETLA